VVDSQQNALDHIGQEMRAAFSLLSCKDAEQAVSSTLAHFESGLEPEFVKRDCPLFWGDIDQTGRYIRGGRYGLLSLSTDNVAQPQDDAEISMIVALAAKERAVAGDIVPLPTEDRFLWFVPVTDSAAKSHARTNLRGILVSRDLCEQVIEIYNYRANLTAAEKRTIFQLVGGLSKRQSAIKDGVSVETKRAHTKNACAKLGCAGQTELIKKVLGQMVPLVTIGDTDTARVRIASDFVTRHLSNDVRLTVQHLPDSQQIRVIECGSLSGRPILLIHGMMWPLFLIDLGRYLEAAGLRIIMPLRWGHLEPTSVPTLHGQDDFAVDFLDSIAAFMRQNFNEPPPVIGKSLGAVLAASFANRYPDLVPQLFLVATNLTQTKESCSPRASRFYGGMNRISQRRQLLQWVTWKYQDYYRNHGTCRDILRNLFGESSTDLSALERRYFGRSKYEIFSDCYQSSVAGIAEDFSFVMQSWQKELESLSCPVTFIQGTHDPLTRVSDFEGALTGSGQRNTIELIQNGGHFLSNSHPEELWGIIGRQIT
jgi:pimeloyl-ACP methyl ester carboxylesterase/DNA-binding CsgD family transcriptional regulator